MAKRRVTKAEQEARQAHMDEHPDCWMCMRLGRLKRQGSVELHHIAGRGRNHECRENYASLCANCHRTIQSRENAELLCLHLKFTYDDQHFSPEKICQLRGRATTWWTIHDVIQIGTIVPLIRDLMR